MEGTKTDSDVSPSSVKEISSQQYVVNTSHFSSMHFHLMIMLASLLGLFAVLHCKPKDTLGKKQNYRLVESPKAKRPRIEIIE